MASLIVWLSHKQGYLYVYLYNDPGHQVLQPSYTSQELIDAADIGIKSITPHAPAVTLPRLCHLAETISIYIQ
jgi:hypothetical protein